MNQESLKYSRLVRIDYQVRTIAFLALYVAIGMHVSGQGYGATAWIALVLQFLVYPHLVFWRARKAENSRKAERTNLTLDSLLLGVWAAALEFPIWIAFTLFLGTTLNNAINGGVRGALSALLAFSGGALAWVLFAGFRFSPHTTVPVTVLCAVGLATYVIGLSAITFVQNRKLRNAREALRQSEEQFRTLAEQLPLGLALIAPDGQYEFINSSFTRLMGYQPDDIPTGRVWFAKAFPDESYRREVIAQWKEDLRAVKQGISRPREYTMTCKDGGKKTILFRPVMMSHGRQSVLYEDITERKQMEDQVLQMAFYDTLTKLPNRRLLSDRLSQAMAASKRSGCHGVMMFLDLDNFKLLNDAHGHAVGDLLLIEAADRLKSCVRQMDTVARFGGDEFVVMIGDLDTDKAEARSQAENVARKIRTALAMPYVLKIQHEGTAETPVEHQCTASIGVALFSKHDAVEDDILKWADKAMYQAKEAGHNLIRFFDPKA